MRRKESTFFCGAVLVLGGALITHAARAQIVNTEPLFRKESDEPYSLMAQGTVNGARGNTDIFQLGLDGAARVREEDHEFLLTGLHERSSANSELVGNRSLGHGRYRYHWTPAIQPEVYGQIAQDPFRRMTHRLVAGVGPRLVPVRIAPLTWVIAFSHMYEVEQLDDSVDFPDGLTRRRHRLNVMNSARVEMKDLTLAQTFYLQPAWADPFNNFRVLHLLTVQAALNKYLSLTWSFEQAFDSIAPSDVKPLDVRFKGGLKFDL